jgi:hypothetical protein
LLGKLPGRGHVGRLCEATGISHDMNELCQHLRGHCDEVARRQQPGKRIPCAGVAAAEADAQLSKPLFEFRNYGQQLSHH